MIPNVSFGWFVFKVLHLIPWRALRGWDSHLPFSSLLFLLLLLLWRVGFLDR
jgi:hypothetical protein